MRLDRLYPAGPGSGRPRVRPLAVLALLAVVLFPVVAQNQQKQYALRSAEYEALRTLYIAQGRALPFSSGPFSEAEIRLAMDRLDTRRMSPAGRRQFDWLRERIAAQSVAGDPVYQEEEGRFAFDVGAEFSVESYVHTDPDNRYWQYRWEDRLPFARFPMEAWVGSHAYGIFDLAFLKNVPDFSLYPTYRSSGQYGFDEDGEFELDTAEEDPWTNWPVVPGRWISSFPTVRLSPSAGSAGAPLSGVTRSTGATDAPAISTSPTTSNGTTACSFLPSGIASSFPGCG